MRPAARALAGAWLAILLLAGGGAAVLQLLGAPKPPQAAWPAAQPSRPATALPASPAPVATTLPAARPPAVAANAAGPAVLVAPPDPALAEPAPDFPGRLLPRIGADGRTPAQAYASQAGASQAGAAKAGLPAPGPRVAVMIEDIGLADEVTAAAIERLPAAISLGVSPYTAALDQPGLPPFLQAARRAGHETWLSLPMEPAGSPLDDEGSEALSTASDLEVDRRALEWSLSRCQGYVGVTNALSGLRGDRFAGSDAFAMVGAALARRGLLYLDAGSLSGDPARPAGPGVRRADLTIDEQPDAADIEARLSRLEQVARDQGSALGIAGPLRPVLIERLQAWSRHLAERGIALVPASALPPPAKAAPAPPAAPPSVPTMAPTVPPIAAAPAATPPAAQRPAVAAPASPPFPSGPP